MPRGTLHWLPLMSARGFLLLEVALAAGVLAVAISALLQLQLHSRQWADEVARRVRISLFAASLAEAWLAGEGGSARLAQARRELPALAGHDVEASVRICRPGADGECRDQDAGPYAIVIDWREHGAKQQLRLLLVPP
ncbi:hypothetical protein [Paludibacterium yongneupense]|uniref:hypothetical protein n=1 Tax=Paludibacterium yongneupense TaxID=400061 RepID=UPI000414D2CD|nr:hypothetical protein [Paludibacterium yongneupense]